ncbi:MAG: hypothetical protein ACTMIR_05895 [Cellulomonadaceae bacterium]
MFVLTIDQQASTARGDLVPTLLAALGDTLAEAPGVELGFERTVGDEVQALISDPATVLTAVRQVIRMGGWSIGLGLGGVATPLPGSSREASGDAFVRARAAVERAKSKSTAVSIAVETAEPTAGADLEALLQLIGAVIARRTATGWQVVDAMTPRRPASVGGSGHHGARRPNRPTQQEVADMLGITRQAVNQRLKTALWAEEVAVWPLARTLLEDADR